MNEGIPRRWLVSPKVQLCLFLLTLLYCLSPIDLIPDTIPIVGWMDDLVVFLADLMAFIAYLKFRRQESQEKASAGK